MTIFLHWPGLAMVVPVIFLLGIIYIDWRMPIADVREIDLFGDHELKLHGIVKSPWHLAGALQAQGQMAQSAGF